MEANTAIERRTVQEKPVFRRFMTGLPSIDEVFGGFPNGLSIFYGGSGTGKSMLAKAIASKHYSLYLCCESLLDFPDGDVIVMDYTKFLPMWDKALNEVLVAIMKYEPDLVIIDSVTTFFSGTKKAVEEADVRSGIFDLSKKIEGIIPIIATSEIRGSGWNTYEAGGRAVGHAASVLCRFDRIRVTNNNSSKYGAKEGDRVYTLDIEKDKQGIAQQGHEYQIVYDDKKIPTLKKIQYTLGD